MYIVVFCLAVCCGSENTAWYSYLESIGALSIGHWLSVYPVIEIFIELFNRERHLFQTVDMHHSSQAWL